MGTQQPHTPRFLAITLVAERIAANECGNLAFRFRRFGVRADPDQPGLT
jgi:hypothetical protein